MEMDFLSWLQKAQSYGVSQDVLFSAWEKQCELSQAKEETRILELKHAMNASNNPISGGNSNTNDLHQMIQHMYQQQMLHILELRQELRTLSDFVGKELFEVKLHLSEASAKIVSIDSQVQKLQHDNVMQKHSENVMESIEKVKSNIVDIQNVLESSPVPIKSFHDNALLTVLPAAPSNPEKDFQHLMITDVQHDKCSDLSGPQAKLTNGNPQPTGPVSYSSALQLPKTQLPAPIPKLNHIKVPEVPTDFKIGTAWGNLNNKTFTDAMRGVGPSGNTAAQGQSGAIKNGHSINMLPSDGAEITIKNLCKFVASGKEHQSDYFYTRGIPCRVQLGIQFNKQKRLVINLLVAPGELDDQHPWPLTFSGSGSVYNTGSRRYTGLWEVNPEKCNRVDDGNAVWLKVYICLASSRDPIEDVDYDTLYKKHYADHGDSLTLKWSLRAESSKGKSAKMETNGRSAKIEPIRKSTKSEPNGKATKIEPPPGMW